MVSHTVAHIQSVIKRAWIRIGILRSMKFLLNRSSLEKMYFSFIRPLLEYSDVVWDNCTLQQKNELESVQNEAARIVTGATKLCNIDKMYNELKWETLATRRKKHKLVLFFKMKNNISPQFLTNLIPGQTQTRYSLRNNSDIPTVRCNTQLYKESFLPSVIRDWNALPEHIKNSPSLNAFKRNLNRNMFKSPKYYYSGSRYGHVLHTRLRLGCSSLNYDLFRKSITDSPHCTCGDIETNSHFLLYCPKYQLQRRNHLSDLPCGFTYQNLIYGSEHLNNDENNLLFLKVQQYILASGRFAA